MTVISGGWPFQTIANKLLNSLPLVSQSSASCDITWQEDLALQAGFWLARILSPVDIPCSGFMFWPDSLPLFTQSVLGVLLHSVFLFTASAHVFAVVFIHCDGMFDCVSVKGAVWIHFENVQMKYDLNSETIKTSSHQMEV